MQSNITPRYNKILRFTSGMFRFQERLLKIKKKKSYVDGFLATKCVIITKS